MPLLCTSKDVWDTALLYALAARNYSAQELLTQFFFLFQCTNLMIPFWWGGGGSYFKVFSVSQTIQCQMVRWLMGKYLEGSGRDLRYYPGIFIKGLCKTMRNLSEDSQRPSWDSNQETPEHKSTITPLHQPVHFRDSCNTGVRSSDTETGLFYHEHFTSVTTVGARPSKQTLTSPLSNLIRTATKLSSHTSISTFSACKRQQSFLNNHPPPPFPNLKPVLFGV